MRARAILGASAAALLVLGLGVAPMPSRAAEPSLPDRAQEEAERARDLIEDALGRVIAGLKLMMDNIPQYEAPEVLENGDILIRRKRPDPAQDGTGQDI